MVAKIHRLTQQSTSKAAANVRHLYTSTHAHCNRNLAPYILVFSPSKTDHPRTSQPSSSDRVCELHQQHRLIAKPSTHNGSVHLEDIVALSRDHRTPTLAQTGKGAAASGSSTSCCESTSDSCFLTALCYATSHHCSPISQIRIVKKPLTWPSGRGADPS